jgi:hypothetical protein
MSPRPESPKTTRAYLWAFSLCVVWVGRDASQDCLHDVVLGVGSNLVNHSSYFDCGDANHCAAISAARVAQKATQVESRYRRTTGDGVGLSQVGMDMKKAKKRTRSTFRGARRAASRMSIARVEERERALSRTRHAEIDPKTKRPKR